MFTNSIIKFSFFLLKILFIYVYREEKRGREISMCGCLSCGPTGDLACNPDMWPDWELNQRPFGSQPTLNPLSYTSQGQFSFCTQISKACYRGTNLCSFLPLPPLPPFFSSFLPPIFTKAITFFRASKVAKELCSTFSETLYHTVMVDT